MAIVIENGSGVAGANTYFDRDFVTTYLTNQARQTENNWSTADTANQDAAVVKATSYIEQRFRLRFKGSKQFGDISQARAVLTLTQQPVAAETVTIGSVMYRFVSSLSAANDVLIDSSRIAQTVHNLIDAVSGNSSVESTTIGPGTVANPDVSALDFYGLSILALARLRGEDGNSLVTTTTVTGASWNFATLTGGRDVSYAQPLSFPRLDLVDSDGFRINGIPDRLKEAGAEYAVRAVAANLLPDPTVDDTGRAVIRKKERVGPIEEETQYAGGGVVSQIFRPYPAADRLLAELLKPGGRVIRA